MIHALTVRNSTEPPAISRRDSPGRAFLALATLLFLGSTALTIQQCTSMSGMGEMPMPGGWTMSMLWMRLPGRTWAATAASFLAMWIVMMVAMMLPSFLPMLQRYRNSIDGTGRSHLNRFTALIALGYFAMWTLFGLAIFPFGVALTSLEMQHPSLARSVPFATGLIILLAGALQFTPWKARHLACCREPYTPPSGLRTALGYGVRLGLHCGLCCAGLTAILLVTGIMQLSSMAVVTLAITLERVTPPRLNMARIIGVLAIAIGLFALAQAAP